MPESGARRPMRWGLPWPGRQLAERAEAAGANAFCAGEFSDRDAYVDNNRDGAQHGDPQIGPGIAYAFARSPFVHASAVRQLHRLAPGRIFLSLGAGTGRMNRDWFAVESERPALRMAELLDVVRAYLHAENGQPIRYSGELIPSMPTSRPVFGRLDVPILIGAFNKIMVRVAGRSADGVLGHGLFTDRWWEEVIDPELARGATSAGRDPSALKRWGWLIAAIDDKDPDQAMREAKLQIAFYLTVRTYDSLVTMHGWHEGVDAIRRHSDRIGLKLSPTT